MARVFNFSAGPAALPEPVLQRAAEEMLDWRGCGMSVMEMSHRGKQFVEIAGRAEQTLRELLQVPDNYRVLFLQGGASGMFAAAPMNLLRGASRADYVNTGAWSKKAIAEARKYCEVNVAAASRDGELRIPPQADWQLSGDAAYLHYTPNETISGVEFHWVPEADAPLVVDMSSTILSRPVNVADYGMIYAGAQKNIGPAGITVVIVRDDLIGDVLPGTPAVWDFKAQAEADSMLNTPPTYAWYVAGLVFEWIRDNGGLQAMGERNRRKAETLYQAIDGSDFYRNPVDPACRSWMNVPFILADSGLDKTFLAEAAEQGLQTLSGHRSVGGMRASIYNAMPQEGVDALVAFMQEFERRHG
ncbi:3-phosphoserine/phosphohydroxythreonine transaminase [Methylonatrum kenyense]|uniref:3-phosphoserine/phosphohydroxythreonine transaminase n=1 Tax=Methylonatrum kenyense TaxID=455253 RepID=UPI0020BFDE42|nr:3-phosphoserine/phosphohydroxythreonine transaminase [Methylonatrum kenyense]MCK8515968.1 3-phosphoserine/phosphohydroxythreonine transaminase [Methylonatrum kenyense]